MTLSIQLLTMIWMVLGGLYLGIVLDTFRRFSPIWEKNRFFTYLFEVCFWLTQTFILYYILYRVNAGELRVYVFAACLLGFAIYQVLVATMYKKVLEKIIHIIVSTFQFLLNVVQTLIITPIQWIIKIALMILSFILQCLFVVIHFTGKVIYFPIKWVLQTIYQLLPEKLQKIINKFRGFYSIIKNIYNKCLNHLPFKRR